MSEGEGEEGFSCHFLSFSTVLPFDIYFFGIFTFDQIRVNRLGASSTSASISSFGCWVPALTPLYYLPCFVRLLRHVMQGTIFELLRICV
jgi:hypothetical protein